MSTTAIFVELLVIGIQASFWVITLVLTFRPNAFSAESFAVLGGFEALVTAAAFAVCYSLGIIVDRAADLFFVVFRPSRVLLSGPELKAIQSWLLRAKRSSSPFQLAIKEGKAVEFFDYFRVRIRITRALTINALLTTFACVLWSFVHFPLDWDLVRNLSGIVALGGFLSFFSYLATGVLDEAYETRKAELADRLKMPTKEATVAQAEKGAEPHAQPDGYPAG